MITLLESVDLLTKPRVSKVVQSNEAGITCTSPVELPPLLDALDEAIRSNMGGTTSGGSDPATRSLVDAGALMKLMQISSTVMSWCRSVDAVIDKQSMTVTLRRWYVKFNECQHEDGMVNWYANQIVKWEGQILALLDPPKEKDLPQHCPSCGAGEWWDPKTKERYYRPLVIKYRPDSPSMTDDATGVCRACGETWKARELQYELELAEQVQETA
ncbi:DUF7341 domain-containing protein [Cryobacterium arcticum]|uniref:DUF7341 domain-containing protein n=1 Tax=Cryobacterium arcticum TaxID=670052 RepID=A0A1B1BPE7_9MICO|nr:hypothetical protein [Cryobacterium arcticum]ANP74522.1 hypothetical protein PA27867_3603 [Cryobacterium arcticum]